MDGSTNKNDTVWQVIYELCGVVRQSRPKPPAPRLVTAKLPAPMSPLAASRPRGDAAGRGPRVRAKEIVELVHLEVSKLLPGTSLPPGKMIRRNVTAPAL
eukprot:scaffold305537_cov19-Tisochrysis_lutea.AAC.1